jgi:nitroimidazol reductase NimA-like FMN-containing flavoprotein (pyridoxamine 5'-phosphate oxidase superfamily)
MIEVMKNFARKKDVCVLATASGENPHCSLMAYTTNEECSEIYMVTYRNTRKFKNMTENPSVSLLIDTRDEHKGSHLPEAEAMTVSGVFERLEDDHEKRIIRDRLLKRHPYLKIFLDHQNSEIVRIRIQSFLLLQGFTDAHFEEISK